MATQSQDDADDFQMAPEKLRRPNSHPFPPNPGKSQSLPDTSGGTNLPRRATDSHNSQNGDLMHGELKRKRSRKSDVQVDGVEQPENLHYGYESYLAYDTSSGIKGVKGGDSLPSRPSGDFFNLAANSHVDPVWESDTKYNNLFSNQNQTGLPDSEGVNFTQAQFGWPNSKEFSQVPLHPPIDLTSGSTFLPFQYNKWDSKDPGLENGANFEFDEKEMIEEIEYMFAQNEWDLPNVSPASPEASDLGMSFEDKEQKSKNDAFKEESFFGDLWSKMGGQERTERCHDQPSGITAQKELSSGETQSQQPKVLCLEDLGDCSSLTSEEKVLLESLISKMNSRKRVNGLRGKVKDTVKETQRVTETSVKEATKCAIHKTSSTTVDHSTVKPDLSKMGQSRIQENGSGIGSSGRVGRQGVQKANSSSLSEQDFPMLGDDDTVDSARKRSKESEHDVNFQSPPDSLCKRDHSGKTKEEIVFSPTPSKNAKIAVEKTKKQKVLESETEIPSQGQKESFEPQNGQESDVEMDNVEEEEIGNNKNIHGFNEKKNVGTAAKRLHNDTEKQEGTVEQPHPQGSSPPQMKKKKKRKKKQGQSPKNEEDEGKSNPGPTPGSCGVSEPMIPKDQQGEVTKESRRWDTKVEGCLVGDQGREHMTDSKGSIESKTQKYQQKMNHQAEQKKTDSAWTQVSGRKGGLSLQNKLKLGGDRTDVRKDRSDKSCAGASQQSEPGQFVKGDAKVGSDKREKEKRNGVSEPMTPPDQKGEGTRESRRGDTKEEGCLVGDEGREHRTDSKGSIESKTQKSQQKMNHQAEQKKTDSAWTQVSGRKGGLSLQNKLKLGGDRTDVRKDRSDKSCAGASQQSEPQQNVNGDAKKHSDKREKERRNSGRSFEHQERPQNLHHSHNGSDGTSFKRKEKKSESDATPKNLKVEKDTTIPQPQAFPSEKREHSSSVSSERSQNGASSNSVPTTKVQGPQAVGKTETNPKVVPNKPEHVLKDDIKSTREASKSLPNASATTSSSSSSSSSSRNGKCEKESKPSRSGMNVKKDVCDGDETVSEETQKERESESKCETKSASGGPHSRIDHKQQSADGGIYKASGQTKRDSERKDKSKEGKTFDELRGRRHDKNEDEKCQRERSGSVKDKKPGRDSTAKSKHSATTSSGRIFLNRHQNFARWKKQITFENLIAVIFAVFTYLKCLAAEIWSELPRFGGILLMCLLAQFLSTFFYFTELLIDIVADIFKTVVAIIRVILSKFSRFKPLWTYILQPILSLALILLLVACYILFRLICLTFSLLRGIYRLKYPAKTDGFTHHEADPNTDDTSRPRQEFHGDSFNHDSGHGQNHSSNGSWENNSGNSANFSGSGEESRGASNNNFRHEGMNGTFGASSNKSQWSQSSGSRPDNKGAVYVIQRILLAEEEDPFDILGLAKDCLQEDIKKAYRRLAVIVHPDKCDHPDAQRAFQKLQVAHEKIGSEENRAKFEQEKRQSDLARTFMDECQKQYDLVKNSMRCQCGNFHPKIATDRNPWTARYCWEHGTFHSAHQNDIWAETSCMGLKIHCFYCHGGIIYDVTQWAQCQKLLGKMEKNGCKVTVKMEGNSEPQNEPPPNFEDYFRQYYGRTGSGSDRFRQKEKNSREKNNKKKKRNGRR